ncbi:MAG: SEC-C metal-binding domain-containing protein [Magnetococcus sp. DMHC-6]
MDSPKDLNVPELYAQGLVHAALEPDVLKIAAWLAGAEDISVTPFAKWYIYLAERLIDLAPKPENGFQARPRRTIPIPKIGRNEACPCGSGKKYKQCHLGQENVVAWKLGSPTPAIRTMAVANLIHALPVSVLDTVPREKASELVLVEMAVAYHRSGHVETGLELLKQVLDGEREDPNLLFDYWVARYAEWLVEADSSGEAERFLLDEFDQLRRVEGWQVAQKLAAFYLDQGDLDAAETWIEEALQGAAENPFNHYLNGLLNHSLDKWESAIQAYEKAREYSNKFREEEKAYMIRLVDESLERARDQRPLDDEEESDNATQDETEMESSL